MNVQLRWILAWIAWLSLVALPSEEVVAQTNLGVTLTTSLTATQSATLTYTLVITNQSTNAIQGIKFTDLLDPNTSLVPGSVNTSPVAFDDAYSVVGHMAISIPAPGVLANDVDSDGVGPALVVSGFDVTSLRGGKVVVSANGGFTYDPPVGFQGTDSFSYRIDDGEGFTDSATVNLTVNGVIWFVNSAAPAGGDGRLKTPFNTITSFNTINNNSASGAKNGHFVFLYSGAYVGPLPLRADQQLIGQGASASLSAITGLTAPLGSASFPLTSGTRPVIGGGISGISLATSNGVRGVNFSTTGGALSGVNLGSLSVLDVAITNATGPAIHLSGGALNVVLDAVHSSGGSSAIALANCSGAFAITGNGASAENGSGGTLQATTGNAVSLDGAVNVSLSRLRILSAGGSGIWGQNVNGLVVDWCQLTSNGDSIGEAGIRLGDPLGANGLVGTASVGPNPTRISNTLIQGSGEHNVAIYNNAGTLQQLDVVNLVSSATRTRLFGADGFLCELRGTATASLAFVHSSFSNNYTQGIQASALGKSVLGLSVVDCGFTNNNEGVVVANAFEGRITFEISSNRFGNTLRSGASGAAIAAVNATTASAESTYSGRIRNNTITGGGLDNHGIVALLAGAGNNTLIVASNVITSPNAQFSGIFVQAGEAGSRGLSGAVQVKGNKVSLGVLGSHGVVVQSRSISLLCAEITDNVSTTGGASLFGINLRQRDTSTFRLPGFGGPFNSGPAVVAFVAGKNPGSSVNATVATAYAGGAACILPLMAPSQAEYLKPTTSSVVPHDFPSEVAPPTNPSASLAPSTPSQPLTDSELQTRVAVARELWARSGLSREQSQLLERIRFEVGELGGWKLGESTPGFARLDRNACGYGWFVAPARFANVDSESGVPQGRIDLLSALVHEMGHQLGLADDYRPSQQGDVMYGVLNPGVRRLPSSKRAMGAESAVDTVPHFLVTALNLGTLPAKKSITITFRVLVTKSMPAGVCALSNQATVSMVGANSVLSDDPRTGALNDPTITAIAQAPLVTTLPASSLGTDGATLNGSVNSCGSSGGFYFDYGPTAMYGFRTPGTPFLSGLGDTAVSAPISGLASGASYHFRVVATNGFGASVGVDRVLVTPIGVLQQPQSVAACVGRTVTFSAAANPPTAGFRWQRRLPGTTNFLNIVGASASSFTTSAMKASDDGVAYRVVIITDAARVTSDEAFIAVITVKNPVWVADFNTKLPDNIAIYGDAYWDAMAGVLELNPGDFGRAGAFLTADLAPSRYVEGFTATFKARLSSNVSPPADGFSFNWATDLPNATYGVAEEGQGSGLSVAFDTFDNGFGEAPAIDVFWKKALVAHRSVPIDFLVRGNVFFDVAIRVTPTGLLDLSYGCDSVFARLPIPGFAPQRGARFGMGSRTGGLWETHGIDDLAIEVAVDPVDGRPRIDAIVPQKAPQGFRLRGVAEPSINLVLESSTDLKTWAWRAYLDVKPNGAWDYVDLGDASGAPRFYRLRSLPQFPSGLLNYYDAEGSFQDRFGPLGGTPIGGIALGAGERGQGFLFDTPDRLVSIQAGPVHAPWTLGLWVKRGTTIDHSASLLFDSATAVKLEQWFDTHQVGLTQFGVADSAFKYVSPLNTWVHLALVAQQESTQLYVNGVPTASLPVVIDLPRGAIGGRLGDRLGGSVDEITIFGRALTVDEVLQVYSVTHGP